MRQSNCSSFMERFQNYLRRSSSDELFYDFEKADIAINGIRKQGGRGCDYAILSSKDKGCNVVLVECKSGELGISDFERGKKQLEHSIDFIKMTFDEPPDLAVICYERAEALVVNILRADLSKRLRHGVRLILRKLSDEGYCAACSLS